MEYLWTDYDSNVFYFIENILHTPYQEKSRTIKTEVGLQIEINPLIRFAEIFIPLIEGIEDEQLRHQIENIFLHYLARLDGRCSIHRFTLEEEKLHRELEMGHYGKKAAEYFKTLTNDEQNKIIALLRRQEEYRGRRLLFNEAIHTMIENAHIYYYEDEQRFLIYIPKFENESDKNKLALIDELFSDFMNNDKKIFWNEHFGIIDQSQTMILDEMILY